MKPRHILVTGGAGYIGSHTAKAVALSGDIPVVFDNLSRGHRHNVRWGPFVHGELDDVALLKTVVRTFQISGCIHLAAHALVGESSQAPLLYFRNNAASTLCLLEVLVQNGAVPIVFSSTCATYGIPEQLPIKENQQQRPINPYGESKLFVERMLEWLGGAHDLRWASLRYFNAAGADPAGELGEEHSPETHLIPLAIRATMDEELPLRIYGCDYDTPDGTAIRDYTHVCDLAQAHVRALEYLQSGGASTAFNLGSGEGHSIYEVIRYLARITGMDVPTLACTRRAGDPPILVADVSKAKEILSWKCNYSNVPDILKTAWRWHTQGQVQRSRCAVAGRQADVVA